MLVEARQASAPRSWQEEARLDAQSVWDGCTSECAGFKSSASKLSTACLSEWLSDVDTGAALRLGMLQFIFAPSHAFSHRIDMWRLSE
jgi:hypothetical protein